MTGPLDPAREDALMPALLAAGLQAWIENAETGGRYKIDPPPAAKPALHARLRLVLDEATEDESHWGFRAIASTSAVAVISRIRTASTMSGIDPASPGRRLILLRRSSWGLGPKTIEVVAAFTAAGGRTATITDDDIATFDALRVLAAEAIGVRGVARSCCAASTSTLLQSLDIGGNGAVAVVDVTAGSTTEEPRCGTPISPVRRTDEPPAGAVNPRKTPSDSDASNSDSTSASGLTSGGDSISDAG